MKAKTALGRTIDMGSLIKKNETTRAVGNMNVNARGDTIDSHNRVIQSVNDKVGKSYSKTVGNRSGQIVSRKTNSQKTASTPVESKDITSSPVVEIASPEESELIKDLAEYDDPEIEAIKQKEENEKKDK